MAQAMDDEDSDSDDTADGIEAPDQEACQVLGGAWHPPGRVRGAPLQEGLPLRQQPAGGDLHRCPATRSERC